MNYHGVHGWDRESQRTVQSQHVVQDTQDCQSSLHAVNVANAEVQDVTGGLSAPAESDLQGLAVALKAILEDILEDATKRHRGRIDWHICTHAVEWHRFGVHALTAAKWTSFR